ncbi:DUF1639 domain-containing protein [Melia azedarach]|uniref:DUF1639 domain-containing protein n=1 Tax=Melia azedarach TaxID=155640 RepID=A0ACC1WUD5_MELAZ|nr:DUF1639 domain-containing protein [Melia azedarach]
MMRYHRVSPDYPPFSNGKKPSLRTTCKGDGETGKPITNNGGFDSSFEGTKGFRFRSPSKTHETHHNNTSGGVPTSPLLSENTNTNTNTTPTNNNNHNSCSSSSSRVDISPNRGGDVLLQWGQKKRARLSRTEIRSLTDDSSSSSSIQGRHQHASKIQRRGSSLMDKLSTPPMPPPPPPPPQPVNGCSSSTRPSNLRNKESYGFINIRNLEDRSGAGNGSPSRNLGCSNTRAASRSMVGKGSSPTSPDKIEKRVSGSLSRKDEKANGLAAANTNHDSASVQSVQEAGATTNTGSIIGGEKINVVEVIEWPKIYISLSRKEKEDDFLAMKGTKLPHRPKKRAKNIDRALQYCFPGMWLSDLTKSRYEVREKKSVKKQKRRGLKGMESMDSDSE